MRIQNVIVILTLLSRGQTRLIKVSLSLIPMILTVVFFTIITTQSLLSAFEKHMEDSFFGVLGELQVTATPNFINTLYPTSALATLAKSYRLTQKSIYLFKGKKRQVLKGVEIIAYERDYLVSKFAVTQPPLGNDSQNGYQDGTLILSSVAYNQLGGGSNPVMTIFNPRNKLEVTFEYNYVIDLGFLGAKPIIVMSIEDLQKLTPNRLAFNQIEFSHVNEADITRIRDTSSQLIKDNFASSYNLINVKTLTTEAKTVFGTLHLLKNSFSAFLVLIGGAIFVLALKLLIASKYRSLQIIECIGVTRQEIIFSMLIAIVFVILVSFVVGLLLSWLTLEPIKDLIGLSLG